MQRDLHEGRLEHFAMLHLEPYQVADMPPFAAHACMHASVWHEPSFCRDPNHARKISPPCAGCAVLPVQDLAAFYGALRALPRSAPTADLGDWFAHLVEQVAPD